MKKYELDNLGEDWIYEANNEEDATKIFINKVCGAKTLKEYEDYCESVGVDPKLNWKLIYEKS